jgi:hypothetical protein
MVQADWHRASGEQFEDCLLTFHHFERDAAAEMVAGLRRRLPKGPAVMCEKLSLRDMIYHSEPWHIACNLAQEELLLTQYHEAYESILASWRKISARLLTETQKCVDLPARD